MLQGLGCRNKRGYGTLDRTRGISAEDGVSFIQDSSTPVCPSKHDVKDITRMSVSRKFDALMSVAKSILLVRDKEETRGGEYVELMHALFRECASKVWLLKKEGIRLSAMLLEYLDRFRVNMRTYASDRDLVTEVIRLLSYELADHKDRI